MNGPGPGWRKVTAEEWMAMRPYVLDLADLSPKAAREVKERFIDSLQRAALLLAKEFDRVPTQEEFEMVGRAVTKFYNEEVVPDYGRTE